MDYSLLKKIILDSFKIDSIDYGNSKILTIAHDNDRGFVYKGKYYSQLIDTIEDDLAKKGIKCVSIARIISTIKGDISYGNVHSPEGGFARALWGKRFLSVFSSQNYPYSKMEEKVWSDILEETKATKVIGIQPSRELCSACHKRNIWVADVQHGVVAEKHPWYGKQFRAKDPVEMLPNSFLIWDRGTEAVLQTWTKEKGIATDVIGNRWISRFKNPLPNDELVNTTSQDFLQKFNNGDKRKVVLVGLSSCMEGIPNGIISDALINVIKKTSKQYRWVLRLHPNQIKGFRSHESKIFFKLYKEHLEGHAEWELVTRTALPVVLLNCNLHIAWHSSVSIEGAQLGIKSALMDPRFGGEYADDYYDYYHKLGFIDFISDNEEAITKWIVDNIDIKLQGEDYTEFDENYRKLIDFLAE